MLQYLFHQIDWVFCPNKKTDTNCEYLISLNKLWQGDEARSTRKRVLRLDLDMIAHLLRLPPRRQDKVAAALAAIPQ